jgi:hypothetical protein
MACLRKGYKLIAIDLDGTLLTPDRRITPRTHRALHVAVESGMLVVICTGRGLPQTVDVIGEIEIRMPLVLHNGAMIAEYPEGRVIERFPLRMNSAHRAVKAMKGIGMTPAVYDWVSGEHLLVCEKGTSPNPALSRYLMGKGPALRWVDDLIGYLDHDVTQIMTIDLRSLVFEVIERLEREVPEARIITSGRVYSDRYWFLEVLDRRASKADALERLGEMYGISPRQMVAIGDNFNDVNMFQQVGLSVAMGNAPDEVKAIADVVTSSNEEEGVAEIIERLIFER